MWISANRRRMIGAAALLVAVLSVPGIAAAQATHLIFISNRTPDPDHSPPHFFPPHITIPVGDTVEWRIPVGHNVVWASAGFPPFPTTSPFAHFHTFDRVGTFIFICTVHKQSGSITVTGQGSDFDISAGLNDAWMNPATPGQGFFINVFPDIGKVFLAWFTYDTERPADSVTANIGEAGQRWQTAFGSYADNIAVLDIENTQGGVFNSAEPAPIQHRNGTIVLEFSDCGSGTVTYDLPSTGRHGVIPVQRVSNDNIPACEQQGVESSSEITGSLINRGLNDAWINPDTPGQGFFINVFPNLGKMFLAWFTYDTERPADTVTANLGDPGHRWLTAIGEYSEDQAMLEIEVTEGGVFDAALPEPEQRADGTVTVDMTDCENGTVTYDIVSANLRGEIPIQRIAPDHVPLCESLAGEVQQSQ